MVQTVQKTVEVPQVQYEDQVVHVPVEKTSARSYDPDGAEDG